MSTVVVLSPARGLARAVIGSGKYTATAVIALLALSFAHMSAWQDLAAYGWALVIIFANVPVTLDDNSVCTSGNCPMDLLRAMLLRGVLRFVAFQASPSMAAIQLHVGDFDVALLLARFTAVAGTRMVAARFRPSTRL